MTGTQQPAPETPTPRTDAEVADMHYRCVLGQTVVPSDFARQLERELAEAKERAVSNDMLWREAIAERDALQRRVQRLFDLVRYQRAELHQADLIDDDEYVALCADDKSVDRLHTYGELRHQLAAARADSEIVDWLETHDIHTLGLFFYDGRWLRDNCDDDEPLPLRSAVPAAIDAARKATP